MRLIFTGDMEFDDAFTLRGPAGLSERSKFVVRADGDRAVRVPAAAWIPADRKMPGERRDLKAGRDEAVEEIFVRDIRENLPVREMFSLRLDARGRVCPEGTPEARTARLGVGSTRVRLYRRSERGRRAGIKEEPLWLNLVLVREIDPPDPRERLCRVLLTDLPIGTDAECLRVAGVYTRRWRIEEFFRTAKDGMQLEASRLDDPESTARLLVLVTLKALMLDAVRGLAELPAGAPPGPEGCRAIKDGRKQAELIEAQTQKGVQPPEFGPRERGLMLLGLLTLWGGWEGKGRSRLGNGILMRGLTTLLVLLHAGHYRWLIEFIPDR